MVSIIGFGLVFINILVGVSSVPQKLTNSISVTNLQKIEELIKNGANVNFIDDNGASALHYASALGDAQIVDKLIKNGADVNILDNENRTPLHRAVLEGYEGVVELLLENHANISIRATNGESATDTVLKALKETKSGSIKYSSLENIHSALQRARTSWKACQVYYNDVSVRISGGRPAEEGEFPWMAALGYLSPNYIVTFDCGGTLISEDFILTAAHCVKPKRPPIVCRLGKLKLIDEEDPMYKIRPTNVAIKEIIRHPSYSIFTKKNDIALIRASTTIQFSTNISPACLHIDLRDESPEVKLIVIGWGSTTSDGADNRRSNDLLKTQLITVPLAECTEKFKEYQSLVNDPGIRGGISDSQYCAYDPQGKNDSCQGDSGGPLQLINPLQASSTIVGIVSIGSGCAGLPGIYTRVSYFLDWIESIVWPEGVTPKSTN